MRLQGVSPSVGIAGGGVGGETGPEIKRREGPAHSRCLLQRGSCRRGGGGVAEEHSPLTRQLQTDDANQAE